MLPAYEEASRIGPALDELFGYLYRGGPARRYGRSAEELGRWDVLVVDDGSTDDTVAVVEARPEAQAGSDGSDAHVAVKWMVSNSCVFVGTLLRTLTLRGSPQVLVLGAISI